MFGKRMVYSSTMKLIYLRLKFIVFKDNDQDNRYVVWSAAGKKEIKWRILVNDKTRQFSNPIDENLNSLKGIMAILEKILYWKKNKSTPS